MGKKKKLLLELERTGTVREKYAAKFANLLSANAKTVDLEQDKKEDTVVEEPVVSAKKVEIEEVSAEVEEESKPKRTRSSTKKTKTSTTKKKATTTTRRKRTTKAKPTTTDI